MNELIVRWKNGETAIYRFTTKGDAVTAKMIFENHCGNEIRDIKINALEQQSSEDCISREEAKQFLYERIDRLNDDELYDIFSRIIDDMYNELPPVTPSYNSIKTETPSYNSIKTELKSCEDCISRQAADFLRELKAYKGAEQEIRGLTQTWEEGAGIKKCIDIIDKWHEEASNADIR